MSESEPPLEIDCHLVHQMRCQDADFLLLDCREPDEHELVRIEGAMLLPMSELAGRLDELEPHSARQVVVYCHHGGRSLRVAGWLRKQGFATAASMAGGIHQWAGEIDRDLPTY